MSMNKFTKVSTLFVAGVFALMGRGAGLVANVHAQTATGTPAVAEVHNDFERELQDLMKEFQKDLTAQKIAHEIDSEDSENAGDEFGDNKVIDGEKSDTEIEKEIDDEVDMESPESEGDNHQGDQENQNATSSFDGASQDSTDSVDSSD